MRRILWDDAIGEDRWWHLARVSIHLGGAASGHGQDFAECFWVEEGRGVHRVNGTPVRLQAGDLVFIRPSDFHLFQTIGRHPFVILNVAFPLHVFAHAQERYASGRTTTFWARGELPEQQRLSGEALLRLGSAARRLASEPQTARAIDRFLLELLDLAEPDGIRPVGKRYPDWLGRVLRELERPGSPILRGVGELVRMAGRSPEHVARQTRALLGRTPSELINQARLEEAARLLVTTDLPVLEVAFESGFETVAHFHKLFRNRYGTTPLRYRRQEGGRFL